MQMTIIQRLDKARAELNAYLNNDQHHPVDRQHDALRALQECYRQLAHASFETQSDVERAAVSSFLHEVDEKVGY